MFPKSQSASASNARGFGRSTDARNNSSKSISFLSVTAFLVLVVTFASAGYLLLRDDIVGSSLIRQARMQQAYEDRIAALRTQVDIVTSKQMLNQQAVENRVEQLMARQRSLSERQEFMKNALKRAKKAGAVENVSKTKAKKKPLTTGSIISKPKTLRLGSLAGTHSPFLKNDSSQPETFGSWNVALAHRPDHSFNDVEKSLDQYEEKQIVQLSAAISKAQQKATRIASLLSRQGVKFPKNELAIGGPLIALKSGDKFLDTVSALDASIEQLNGVRKFAATIPHGSPTPGQKISSRYGARKDPFTHRRAVHGGLDFKAKTGVRVLATASGVVTKAGRQGGYGKLVEIKHANGITTRYAHLSRIKVKTGQRIVKGTTVGNVGSTGRSTGPHLHYEVRIGGKTVDPIRYVRLGKVLYPYM